MTGTVTGLWRHPIKSHGREALDSVTLNPGQTMPGDRVWAVAHEMSQADGSEWVHCGHFSRVSKVPELMAITATVIINSITVNPLLVENPFFPFCGSLLYSALVGISHLRRI